MREIDQSLTRATIGKRKRGEGRANELKKNAAMIYIARCRERVYHLSRFNPQNLEMNAKFRDLVMGGGLLEH